MTTDLITNDAPTAIDDVPENAPGGGIAVAYVLSAAMPRADCYGGLHELATRHFTARADELVTSATGLREWMVAVLTRRHAPIGLYVGECLLPDAAESDRDWLSEDSIAWYDNGEWPVEAHLHPSLVATQVDGTSTR